MRILICSNAYPPHFIGGAELIAHYQAKALQDAGHEVLVFAGEGQVHGERYTIKADTFEGVAVRRIFVSHEDFRSDMVNFQKHAIDTRFQDLLDEFHPEVVHFHNLIGLSLGMIPLAKSAGATTVMTLHDNWGFCYRNTMILDNGTVCQDPSKCAACQAGVRDTEKTWIPMEVRKDYFFLQLQEVDWFVSPSRYQAENYLKAGIPNHAMTVLRNGVDLHRFAKTKRRPQHGHTRFTFIGYLGAHKGVGLLIKAVARIGNRQIRLNLVGSGDERGACEKLAKDLGIESMLHFWGKVPNSHIGEVLAETDVLVLPSIWPENQPVSITEAMASSIAVVGSNAGGIPELIEDRRTGFVFPLGNEVELADRLGRFVSEPQLIEQMGRAGRVAIADGGFEATTKRLVDLYLRGPRKTAVNRDYVIGVSGALEAKELASLQTLQRDSRSIRKFRFVNYDWLTPDQKKKVSFRWLTESGGAAAEGSGPFLVPEKKETLMNSVRKNRSGLGYANQAELVESLRFLRDHRDVAAGLAGPQNDAPVDGGERSSL